MSRAAYIRFTRSWAIRPYPDMLFHLILSHSGWRYAKVATGETSLALQQGLQAALWSLGGVPRWCAATILPPILTRCAAAAAGPLMTPNKPCWTTTASAPPASTGAITTKTG